MFLRGCEADQPHVWEGVVERTKPDALTGAKDHLNIADRALVLKWVSPRVH